MWHGFDLWSNGSLSLSLCLSVCTRFVDSGLVKLYHKREDTMASGIVLLNEQYDVHRYDVVAVVVFHMWIQCRAE